MPAKFVTEQKVEDVMCRVNMLPKQKVEDVMCQVNRLR